MPETQLGLLALAALFVIPFLPDWSLFEGPRKVKHWPRRQFAATAARHGPKGTTAGSSRPT